MFGMNLGAGLKWGAIAAIVLVAGLILFYMIQSTKNATRNELLLELENVEEEIREKGDDALDGAPDNLLDSLHYLRDRFSD